MTDLQLGLLIIGVLAVAGVLLYNRLQERSVRRDAERAFGSRHADVLLAEPHLDERQRREPGLEPAHRQQAAPPSDSMPDERVDYIVDLGLQRPAAAGSLLEFWAPIERRFAKRALLAASDGRGWRRLGAGDTGTCTALRAGLQLVSRAGVTGDAELIEFRSEVETFGGRIGAAISAPEMRAALDAAGELDRACVEADIQVALHVVEAQISDEVLAGFADQPFQVARRGDDLTFTMDVPRVLDIGRSYEAMARSARQLAASSGGRLVDDRGKSLDEHALAAIGTQLEPARRLLAERGIEPGSALALRLFS